MKADIQIGFFLKGVYQTQQPWFLANPYSSKFAKNLIQSSGVTFGNTLPIP